MDLETLRTLLVDPREHEIEIGFALLEMQRTELYPGGRSSLRQLVEKSLRLRPSSQVGQSGYCPDYSTVMRWVRAAGSLQDPDDPRAGWGVQRLLELLVIEDEELRECFIARHDVKALHVRALRSEIADYLGREEAPDAPALPHEVTAQVVRAALMRAGLDPVAAGLRITRGRKTDGAGAVRISVQVGAGPSARALSMAGDVLEEIVTARMVWRKAVPGNPPPRHESIPLEDVDALGPGPVQVRWAARDLVEVTKRDTAIARIPVRRETVGRILKREGNRKTVGVTPMLGSVYLGCLRRATGFPNCDFPCYREDGASRGCFSNWTEYAIHQDNQEKGFEIIHNGLANDLLSIRLPSTGSPSLKQSTSRAGTPDPMFLRVDGESTDGALSIGLGIIQMWAEANPQALFTTICSHAVRPSDTMLHWLAALPNVWVGHTVSAWFDPMELEHRFTCVERFIEFGIPSVVWITTSSNWDNAPVLRRALRLVPPTSIVEYPLRGDHKQEMPILHENPLGACGDHRQDTAHRWFTVKWKPDSERTGFVPYLSRDGHTHPPKGMLHSRCRGCRLKCGVNVLGSRHPGMSRVRPPAMTD